MGRRLGQHFLFQESILEKIAEAACGARARRVIEIGCGPGTLTRLLLERAEEVIGIETDARLAAELRRQFASDAAFRLVEGDVLEVDFEPLSPAVVCGNIPYYITGPILKKTLALGRGLERAVFLVQREVAERLAAQPGSRDYGFLSVAAQALCRVERICAVRAGAFRPPPKVDSAVVRLTPLEAPRVEDHAAFLEFAARCFRQKRKTLRNNLGCGEIPHAARRAEELTVEELEQVRREWARGRA
ncbi:MAG: 16S rRNA (adenine(1518)-N(6)/adenine(1519)-N(6))-dimethyltransferase RsmA [Bryobacteraceae bacterium]|nr:16S rRNA (adenine(1518)-N(6)/adenine(1519)-N(6))-dimethyltransferase RsmA [Bryobacteraceae bacterium]